MLNMRTRRQAGVSLVELMVGIVVGLIVLLGMSSVYINSARSSRTSATANQLNQDMRAVMDIMVNDIRRSGYWFSPVTGTNPFTAGTTNIQITSPAANNDCILYAYDATHAGGTAGVVDGVDRFGFRLDGGVVKTLRSNTLASTSDACSTGTWDNLTDERAITVTALTMNTGGSKCIAFVPGTYDATVASTYTAWTTNAGVVAAACNETVNNNNVAPSAAASAAAGNNFIETRQINITLSARSSTDNSLTRTLSETVLVRNNRLIP